MSSLLLHGLGATGGVWRGLVALSPGGCLAPDLPGHGSSAWAAPYSFDGHAQAVASQLPDGPVTLLGHSMGGVVALALARMLPDQVEKVVCLGVKVSWSDEDVARASALAAKPPARFATRAEAADRFLKVSGLLGLVDPTDPMLESALVDDDGSWRLAQDPATFGVGVPDMAALIGSARCPVVLARGEHDGLVSDEELAVLVPDAVRLDGLGHNAHVEDPAAVLGLL